ncbi:hypothetical protein FGO68_gene7325 [Halteria grandinella]|uniref:Tr-type G domain-containing protein n=1 Tax=Halteria grandinella TaxID=5974 RepID=A0A8J8T2Y1_HALGN|nr:hypothetical protein FGO68_gene7325 [Halteria grandinella]
MLNTSLGSRIVVIRQYRIFIKALSPLNKKVHSSMLCQNEDEFAESMEKKKKVTFVMLGPPQHGKSSVLGALSYQSMSTLAQQESDIRFKQATFSEAPKQEYAWMMDQFQEEKQDGTHIPAFAIIEKGNLILQFVDAPGGNTTKNEQMRHRAISMGEFGIVVLSAAPTDGVENFFMEDLWHEQMTFIREAVLLGIKSFIFVINKLDEAKWNFAKFIELQKAIKTSMKHHFYDQQKTELHFIPASGKLGINIYEKLVKPPKKLQWLNQGKLTLLEACMKLGEQKAHGSLSPLRMPVFDVYRTLKDREIIVIGKILQGEIYTKMKILLSHSNEAFLVSSVKHICQIGEGKDYKDYELICASPDSIVAVNLGRLPLNFKIAIGDMISNPKIDAARLIESFRAKFTTLQDQYLLCEKEYQLIANTTQVRILVKQIFNSDSFEQIQPEINPVSTAYIKVEVLEPLHLVSSYVSSLISSFVLRDESGEMIGSGHVRDSNKVKKQESNK